MSYYISKSIINKIGNRFDLVLIASFRARQIQIFSKNNYLKELKNDKSTILALKEIKNNLIDNSIFDIIFNKKINNF